MYILTISLSTLRFGSNYKAGNEYMNVNDRVNHHTIKLMHHFYCTDISTLVKVRIYAIKMSDKTQLKFDL